MARVDTLGNFLTDVADAIRTKTGSSETIQASDFDTAIENIPSGGSTEVPEKDVNFYDYDGTRVYSYDKDEFLALEELPANPTHEGLLGQGWNWTYQQMMDYVTDYGICDVGQMYTTSDGNTRIYTSGNDFNKPLKVGLAVNGTVKINWGDESEETTMTGTSLTTILSSTVHTYSQKGDYIITIKPQENSEFCITGNISSYAGYPSLLGPSSYSNYNSPTLAYYRKLIKKIEIGNNAKIGRAGINIMPNLETITLPTTIVNDNFYQNFNGCYRLNNIVIPSTVTQMSDNNKSNGSFITQSYFERIIFPNTITDFSYIYGNYGAPNLVILKNRILPSSLTTESRNGNAYGDGVSIILPEAITTFGDIGSKFTYTSAIIFKGDLQSISCLGWGVYVPIIDLSNCTAVPTITGSQIYVNSGSNDYIIVPDDLYEDWIVADKWSTIANKIIKKSDWEAQQ